MSEPVLYFYIKGITIALLLQHIRAQMTKYNTTHHTMTKCKYSVQYKYIIIHNAIQHTVQLYKYIHNIGIHTTSNPNRYNCNTQHKMTKYNTLQHKTKLQQNTATNQTQTDDISFLPNACQCRMQNAGVFAMRIDQMDLPCRWRQLCLEFTKISITR